MSLGCVEIEPRAMPSRCLRDVVLEFSNFGLKIQHQAGVLEHCKN